MIEFLKELIAAEGSLPMDRYMALCLGHPKFGYYMSRDPFGAAGDFTTAPEISQVFGELLGIWCVAAWEAIGQPSPFILVELGPGRGTLMADILRATSRMDEFQAALKVHLVEISPILRKLQREKLGDAVQWHETIETLPQEPMVFVANEFFDALPIRQILKHLGQSYERCVGVEDGALASQIRPVPTMPLGADGLYEIAPAALAIAESLGARLAALGGAGLVIDYGHLKTAVGDTLQALKGHKACGVFEFPGTSDLTAHVDFEALSRAFASGGAVALPPMTQGTYLRDMGIEQRLTTLSAKLQGKPREDFIAGGKRLVGDRDMGQLFKVLCVAQPQRQPIYPFESS